MNEVRDSLNVLALMDLIMFLHGQQKLADIGRVSAICSESFGLTQQLSVLDRNIAFV